MQASQLNSVDESIRHVVVVGGGSAGWLVAGVLAADHDAASATGLRVTLVESPDVATIGVGEGTWPSMRDTLRKIGVSESDFLRECDATFKQGSRFARWVADSNADRYDHPFALPHGYMDADLVAGWQARPGTRFADLVSVQTRLCEAGKAPKQFATPEYAAVANYAYHLDAGKLGSFLRKHCVEKLGVHHVVGHVEAIDAHDNGDIAALRMRDGRDVSGDLFVDCTGMQALLIGKHYGVDVVDCSGVLFNDRAWAVQVPYAEASAPIACQTISTAQACGWTWDIGLQSRRGVGHVYSGAHMDDEAALQVLADHVELTGGSMDAATAPRLLRFAPGYRRTPWHRNCVAIGLSGGFVEPLEASSLVLVELAAAMLSEQLPATRPVMDIVAARFNETFDYRWGRVVDFLKLHYVLSQRVGDYWIDHRKHESCPERLRSLRELWRYQPPSRYDLPRSEEIFPWASYQYVLYGMGQGPLPRATTLPADLARRADARFGETDALARRMLAALPTHREMLEHAARNDMPTI